MSYSVEIIAQVPGVSQKFCLKSHLLFFFRRNTICAGWKKPLILSNMSLLVQSDCFEILSENSYFVLLQSKNKKIVYPTEKILQIVKIVALIHGIFIKTQSKIIPCLFFHKKNSKKEEEQNVTLCKNFRSGTVDFFSNVDYNLYFVLLDQKQQRKTVHHSENR